MISEAQAEALAAHYKRESWDEFLATVEVGGAIPVYFAVVGNEIEVSANVPDQFTGETISISYTAPIPPWDPKIHVEVCQEWILKQVVRIYCHEAKEQLAINGVRVFEPVEEHAKVTDQ